MEDQNKKIKCEECGKYFGSLGTHIRIHGFKSKREYQLKYPDADIISAEYKQKQKDRAIARYENEEFRKKVGRRTFDFIKDTGLKNLLQRDYRSAQACLKNQLWKPAIILYGSIIEAILIEKTGKSGFDRASKEALKKKIISEKQYHKVFLVRDLRNFVHIHKELKEKEEINDYWARTFGDICESIIIFFKK